MGAITNDANLGLMKLIVVALTILVATTVYYQYTFSDIYSTYQNNVELLQEKNQDIENYRTVLREAKEDLENTDEREQILGDQIQKLRHSNEDTEYYKNEVERLMIELAKEQQKSLNLNSELTYHDVNVQDLQEEIAELTEEIEELKDEKRALLARL